MTQPNSKGFSLIEVLVSLFVVSIGLLGIAGMELFSAQSGNEAVQRASAVWLSQEIMEKMRANPTALSSYVGVSVGNGSLSTPSTDCGSSSASCKGTELATYDLWSWENLVDGATEKSGTTKTGGLDNPQGCITGPAGGASGVYTIAIAWRGNTSMGNPTTSTCGNTSGLYGASNEFRRVMVINFYVSNSGFS